MFRSPLVYLGLQTLRLILLKIGKEQGALLKSMGNNLLCCVARQELVLD